MKKGFTLLELIVVIVIIGVLATLGFTQYSRQVEYSRITEAKVRIGFMRNRALEYYYKNGTLTGIQLGDVGVDEAYYSNSYFAYTINIHAPSSDHLDLGGVRAVAGVGGKPPGASSQYVFYLTYYPGTGVSNWHCYYSSDASPCFGYTAGTGTD